MLSLLLFAATLQSTPVLDADPVKAAIRCGYVAPSMDATDGDKLKATSTVLFFAMTASKADPGNVGFVDRAKQFSARIGEQKDSTAPTAAEYAACKVRFPLAFATGPATLPTDTFDRDMMCFSVASILQGAAEGIAEDGDPRDIQRIKPMVDSFMAKYTDSELARHGITTQKDVLEMLAVALKAGLNVGTAERIALSCGMAPR